MAYTIEEEQELNQLKEWWKTMAKHYCRFYSWCRRDVGLALLAVLSSQSNHASVC